MAGRLPSIGDARDSTAERGLEWTGERMLPWTDDPALAYEHLHRYVFASRLAEGRRVLDIGCGEGYGTALVASRAASVVGIDVDPAAIAHAAATYVAPNVSFVSASADELGAYEDGSFDLVVCFEVIEHLEAQERVVAEARRVLTDAGCFICSTPERDVYRERTGEVNPFHVRELDQREFRELLRASFPNVAFWAQQTVTGSLVEPLPSSDAPGSAAYVERHGEHWDICESPEPVYLIAVASAGAVPDLGLSVVADRELLLYQQQRERADRREHELHDARVDLAGAEERVRVLRVGLERRDEEVRELLGKIDDLQAELLGLGETAFASEVRIAELERDLSQVENSPSWRALEAVRARLRRADGTPNLIGRAASTVLTAMARRLPDRSRRGDV